MRIGGLIWLVLGMVAACAPSYPGEVEEALREITEADFNEHIRPILSDRCYNCHGPDNESREADLRLDITHEDNLHWESSRVASIFGSGRAGRSAIVERILAREPDMIMPPPASKLALTSREKALLIKWIDQGAPYEKHWAWLSPKHEGGNKDLDYETIDELIDQKCEEVGLLSGPLADEETLVRRAYFDLVGLPPTEEELETYLAADPKDRWLDLIDKLQHSPHYGERMATDWLDLARYADTHGYTVDRFREMSPWRDWVIKAFNRHMPYDEFVTWQLAGDLMPGATPEQVLATGFNRNHPQNMEGGIVAEEFRVEYTVDRTNTFGTAFLGLTVGCARCHDHKYDPISQKEYFQLLSYFDNIDESGQISWDNAMPSPTARLTSPRIDSIVAMFDLEAESLEREIALKASASQSTQRLRAPAPVAHFDFSNRRAVDRLNSRAVGTSRNSTMEVPIRYKQHGGKVGLALDGDAWVSLGETAVYDRHEPFSISIDVMLPDSLIDGVIFHKGEGAIIYCFRGYHLALRDNGLEILLARTAPDNCIRLFSGAPIRRNQWINMVMTYDGSSRADGCALYIDGQEVALKTEQDNLYGSILFDREKEPGLQLGARWRGSGIKGASISEVRVFDTELTSGDLRIDRQNTAGEVSAQERSQISFRQSPEGVAMLSALADIRNKRNLSLDTLQEVMVMRESNEERQTYVLDRGQYDSPTTPVDSDVPDFISFSDQRPVNRLDLARWLFSPEHPLTARVVVNRIWQSFFGTGLIETAEDFGSQGSKVSHPKLLDFLSLSLIENDWSIPQLQKMIMSSDAYRRSSKTLRDNEGKDVMNRFMARGPAKRMSAEMIRDNALAASNLLNREIGGPSVKPYQPEGLWKVNQGHYQQDTGEKLFRRSLYTIWKRSVPYPTLQTFDAPERSECTPRRQRTSTPLQSLVLLNDPTFVEAARMLAARCNREDSIADQVAEMFARACQRMPLPSEATVLERLYQQEHDRFSKAPEKMQGWLSLGETGAAHVTHNTKREVHAAAMSVVASTILNSDAAIFIR